MTDQTFAPIVDRDAFATRTSAALRAIAELMDAMLAALPSSKRDSLSLLISGGGWVGVETVTNGARMNRIRLVGIEAEGARLVLAEVPLATDGACPH